MVDQNEFWDLSLKEASGVEAERKLVAIYDTCLNHSFVSEDSVELRQKFKDFYDRNLASSDGREAVVIYGSVGFGFATKNSDIDAVLITGKKQSGSKEVEHEYRETKISIRVIEVEELRELTAKLTESQRIEDLSGRDLEKLCALFGPQIAGSSEFYKETQKDILALVLENHSMANQIWQKIRFQFQLMFGSYLFVTGRKIKQPSFDRLWRQLLIQQEGDQEQAKQDLQAYHSLHSHLTLPSLNEMLVARGLLPLIEDMPRDVLCAPLELGEDGQLRVVSGENWPDNIIEHGFFRR